MSDKKVCSNTECGRPIRSKTHDKCYKCRSATQNNNSQVQSELTQLSHEQGIVNTLAPKRSNFFIVMSNGKTASSEESTNKFIGVIKQLYVERKIEHFLHDLNQNPLVIEKLDIISGAIESGDVRGKINHHANVVVHHRNKLQINLPLLRDECKKIMGQDMFIRVKLVRDELAMTMNYASKNI